MKRQHEPSTEKPLELAEFLCFAIYSANHAFNRVYQPLLRDLRLTYPQFIALILLWGQDGQTVGELGERLFLQSNTLTPMLKRLEALRYIKRSRDAADERQVRIHLTEAGRKLHLDASGIVRAVRNATGLQEKQVRDLVRDVAGLRRTLERHRPR
ncbi:MAG TPA: MarR family transcriptional regulator [Steroidobacteraceae bacterium]|nr:MarR family transcriptional regulator [Steroidobacteraceae bacterium]